MHAVKGSAFLVRTQREREIAFAVDIIEKVEDNTTVMTFLKRETLISKEEEGKKDTRQLSLKTMIKEIECCGRKTRDDSYPRSQRAFFGRIHPPVRIALKRTGTRVMFGV